MSRFRSRWLALFGGATLIALSMSSALGAKPEAGENRGQQVSTFVHSLVGDVEETTDETADDTEVVADDSAPSDHGTCVAEVAQNHDEVGGDNANHGGAVSEAARVTCWDEGAAPEPNTEEPTEDQGDSEVESDADADTEVEQADDADASGGGEHGNGHGDGHGNDGADD